MPLHNVILESKSTWYKNLAIHVGPQLLYTNLIVIKMSDYDVILGMERLNTHHAIIDCQNKQVLFQPQEKKGF